MAREPFNRIWTETPTVDDFDEPTNTMWDAGWRGGADQDPPEAFAQNWWQNRADFALQQIERQGYMDYDADAIYQIGGRARGSDGEFYVSITSPNTGNDPVTDGGVNWILYPVNDMTLANKGHYRMPGGFLVQWVRVDGLDSPSTSVGDSITHTINFEIPFTMVFGAIPTGVDDPSSVDGSEVSSAISSITTTGATVRFTRVTGTNIGDSEVLGCFLIALGF